MTSEIPPQPSQLCEHCHLALVFHPNPNWDEVKHLFKTDQLRQSVYWIAAEHPACSATAQKNETSEKEAKRRKDHRESVKRNLRELGFAQFTKEFPAAPFQLHPGVEVAYKAMKEWSFQRKGILLIGPPGRGKSHLTGTLGAKFSDHSEMSAAFTTMSGLLALLRRGYDEDVFDERLRMVSSQVHILILDDLGAEKATEWGEEKLYMILDTRLNFAAEPRPLFVTTNLTAKELSDRYHPRIVSRLHEMCHWIEVTGPDFRTLRSSVPAEPTSPSPPPPIEPLKREPKLPPAKQPQPTLHKPESKKERALDLKADLQPELELDYRPQLFRDPQF